MPKKSKAEKKVKRPGEPRFEPGTQMDSAGVFLVVDQDGAAWWVTPESREVRRALVGPAT